MLLYVPRNFRNAFIVGAMLLSSVFPLGWVEKLEFVEDIFQAVKELLIRSF